MPERIRPHKLFEMATRHEVPVYDTNFEEIEAFLKDVAAAKLPPSIALNHNLHGKHWSYPYAPGMKTWMFMGNQDHQPTKPEEATSIITTDAWLMPKEKETDRKGLQISGYNPMTGRCEAMTYDQDSLLLVRAGVSLHEKELPSEIDPDALDTPGTHSYYSAGLITPAMLAQTHGHTRIINLRSIMPIDATDPRWFAVQARAMGQQVAEFTFTPVNGNYRIHSKEGHILAAIPRQLPKV